MNSLFSFTCKARNNEEYRAVLKKRQRVMCFCILAGFVTEAVVLFVYFCDFVELSDYRLGFLLGLGGGLALGGVVGLLRIRGKLADEEKLKEARLKETDEREIEVNSRALQGAARILLAALYILLILGGVLRDDKTMGIVWILLAVFLIGDVALKKYYEAKL
ncbi:MAG: hypothetical protein NC432_07030 [Roseburia sp.]|nr:hypothetical protein [Roseburia sp.]MCM1098185.1 hypothetical protein [Ruminococcus flavefaciens]